MITELICIAALLVDSIQSLDDTESSNCSETNEKEFLIGFLLGALFIMAILSIASCCTTIYTTRTYIEVIREQEVQKSD